MPLAASRSILAPHPGQLETQNTPPLPVRPAALYLWTAPTEADKSIAIGKEQGARGPLGRRTLITTFDVVR